VGMTAQSQNSPFDIRDGRAMISLGPLSERMYCPYSCLFCYVTTHFHSYARWSNKEVVTWLSQQTNDDFDIIYVSGDTDSFAPPRQDRGVKLLRELLSLGKDVLFTTRTVFDGPAIEELNQISLSYREQGLMLIGCISISQWTKAYLEPYPIPTPEQRIDQLRKFKQIGIISVLAMRPFLPVVPLSDYISILTAAKPHIDIVLGEAWYADSEGIMEKIIMGNKKLGSYHLAEMPFDENNAIWRVYEYSEVEDYCRQWSVKNGIPFFMRSRPAINYLRQRDL